jgi:hypothetical protein
MDRRTFIKGATVAVGGFTLLGAQGCEPGPIAGQGYRQVFDDDFETLNTNVWGPTPAHRDTIPPGAFTVADSILTVRADLSRPRPYEELTTLGPFSSTVPHYPQATAWQEGYFEIRARCTNDPWTKLALWFFSLEAPNYANATRPCVHLNSDGGDGLSWRRALRLACVERQVDLHRAHDIPRRAAAQDSGAL